MRPNSPVRIAIAVAVLPLVAAAAVAAPARSSTPATRTDTGPAPIADAEAPCESLPGDPTPALDGLDFGETVTIDVAVLLDGVTQADAEALIGRAAGPYMPLDINLDAVSYESVTFTTTDSRELIDAAKDHFDGARPAGADIVALLTSKNIRNSISGTVVGQADCVGGAAYAGHAFFVVEAYVADLQPVRPLGFTTDVAAKATAHEIGHLFGAHHHYANCVEGISTDDAATPDGRVELSACTLMFNDVGLISPNFSALNAAVVRGYAVRYAQP